MNENLPINPKDGVLNEHYGIKTYYRDDNEQSFFKVSQNEIVKKLMSVPFLNGGLFECLDKVLPPEGEFKVQYIDGFSRNKKRRALVPNILFWNEVEKQPGIITILSRYNFTVEESTPSDIQVALDPELLGKVFENLLGTYNPETSESARKESGSFYTPREIVSYMVNHSIMSYLQEKVSDISKDNLEKLTNDDKSDDADINLTEEQIFAIRQALFEIKIIDPACGSGAFPMGFLNKLVEIHTLLNKLSANIESNCNLFIKKGQCINYTPNDKLKINAKYLGDQKFELSVNGKTEDKIYNSQELALYAKEIINKHNKDLNKNTIANLFSQGRIDDGKSFNAIKTTHDIRQIVDSETKEIVWQYKSYKVSNKSRPYRNEEDELLNYDILYNLKMQIIQDSIFGADIQPIAVQICKLRFFISLICEQPKTGNTENNYGYNPLPNLETKFVAANTLIGLAKIDINKESFDLFRTDEISNKQKELQKIRHDHFGVKDVNEKIEIRRTDKNLRKELAMLLEKTNVFAPEDVIQLTFWNPYDQNAVADFFDANWMFGIEDGFDIVIGNPPYISAPTQLANKFLAKQREKIIKSNNYKSLYQKWDLYIPFIELGLNLNCQKGITTMIVPFPLTNQLYAKVLRNMIVKENNMLELVDLNGTKIFENATVSNCIPFIKKSAPKEKTWISHINEKLEIIKIFEQPFSALVQDEKTQVWNVTQEKREANKYSDFHVLGDFCYVSYGLRLNSDEKTAKGEFKKEDLISNVKDNIPRRKYIEAKDIEKYKINRIRYLEYGTERSPKKLVRPTFNEWFSIPKMFFNRLGDLTGTFDKENNYLHNDSIIGAGLWKSLKGVENKSISSSIKKYSKYSRSEMEKLSETVDLKYLLGIMNSKYASVLLTNLRGGDYHIYPEHIRNIPIPVATPAQQQQIIALVDKILAMKKRDSSADTTALESEIDELVYNLYGLTDEEKGIIRNN